ncbi:MAG: hypothetical protein NVSMB1_07790 [Polyangiales bacterium]
MITAPMFDSAARTWLYKLCLIGVLASSLGGCRRQKDAPNVVDANTSETSAQGELAQAAASAAEGAEGPDLDEVRSVYPLEVAKDPIAQEFCAVLHDLRETRRAACCEQKVGLVLTAECVRMLSAALSAKALTLDRDDVKRCETAMAKSLSGCDWVGPFPPGPPAECQGILHGALKARAICRSTLECEGNLHCRGAGPTQAGWCMPPNPDGAGCGSGVDALAGYALQNQTGVTHPECSGVCDMHRCAAAKNVGSVCKVSVECRTGLSCAGGICAAVAPAKVGQPCPAHVCEGGARCLQGKCVARKAAGEACDSDFDCTGGCVRAPSSKSGTCGKRCDVR